VRGPRWVIGENWHEMRRSKEGSGYLLVNLRKDRRERSMKVHTLMLLTFVGPRPDGMECRHRNGDRTDNRLANLSWGTPRENADDRVLHGTVARGERIANSVLSVQKVRQIRRWAAAGQTQTEIARRLGVHRATVGDVVAGRQWAHVR
jgi:hypothetical protein